MFIDAYDEPPLVALTYLTGECNYGGRVTDDRDRRLILSLLSIFYCSDVIDDDNYKLSTSGLYSVPASGSYETFLAYIRSLPHTPHPEVIIDTPTHRHTCGKDKQGIVMETLNRNVSLIIITSIKNVLHF